MNSVSAKSCPRLRRPRRGKTTVAEPLAAALGFALLSKDPIKEALFDALDGCAGDLAQSRKFSDAAIAVMFAVAAQCPQVVLEADFHPHSVHERERIKNLAARLWRCIAVPRRK